MSKYTSTIEGFQKLVQWSLDGPATDEDVKAYVESTSTSTFYQVINGKRTEYDDYVKHIKEWRGKVSDYKVEVCQFLRDGNQLAARLVGSFKMDDTENTFEAFIFAQVAEDSGKLEWLIERAV